MSVACVATLISEFDSKAREEHRQLERVIGQVRYKDWNPRLVTTPGGDHYFQWGFRAKCTTTGEVKDWTTRKYKLSIHMTEGELVQTAFMAALQAEEHECRENFKYQGIAPFNPHIAFSALMAAAHHIEGRK